MLCYFLAEPISVNITTEDAPLSEGREAHLTCTVVGSHPSPSVYWYQQGLRIKPLHIQVFDSFNFVFETCKNFINKVDFSKTIY